MQPTGEQIDENGYKFAQFLAFSERIAAILDSHRHFYVR